MKNGVSAHCLREITLTNNYNPYNLGAIYWYAMSTMIKRAWKNSAPVDKDISMEGKEDPSCSEIETIAQII